MSKAFTIGNLSGTRAAISDVTLAGTRGVIHDVPPFGTTGTSAVEDPSSPEFSVANRMAELVSAADATRPVHDVAPFDMGTTGDTQTVDPTMPDTSSDHSWG